MAKCIKCGRNLQSFSFKRICPWCVQHEAAQRGEDSEYQQVMHAPWRRNAVPVAFTQVFTGICVAVFLGMLLSGISPIDPEIAPLLHWGANYAPFTFGGEWWRLITYMFLHIGLLHIALNMWCLWSIGALAESIYGHWTFAAIYLLSGLGGGFASAYWQSTVSAGASGAIFGIAGALIAYYKFGDLTFNRGAIQGSLTSILAFVAYSLIFGFVRGGHTDNACHLGGLITGFALGALIALVAPDNAAVLRRALIMVLVLGAIAGATFYTQHSRGYNVYAQRGGELLETGRTDEAIAQLQTAVRMQPGNIDWRLDLAQAYLSKSQFAQAEEELKQALQVQPKNADILNSLAYCYFSEKKFSEARQVYLHMVELDHNSAPAHFGLGMIAGAEGKHQDAIHEYTAAAGIDPSLNGVYYNVGHSYAELKNYDAAIAAYQREQRLSGDDSDIENALAQAYRAKGMQAEAVEAEKKAAQLK